MGMVSKTHLQVVFIVTSLKSSGLVCSSLGTVINLVIRNVLLERRCMPIKGKKNVHKPCKKEFAMRLSADHVEPREDLCFLAVWSAAKQEESL